MPMLPPVVEIVEPERPNMTSKDISNFINELLGSIHQNSKRVKTLSAQNKLIDKNGKALIRNFVIILLKEKDYTSEDLAKKIGLPPENAQNFLDEMAKNNLIIKKGELYTLNG